MRSDENKKMVIKTETSSRSGETTEEDKWNRKIEFFLAMLGYTVGFGKLWRFPYLCMQNGGGAFLIPFALCIIFIAFPIFLLETALGQFTAKSTIYCWEACPVFKGVGYGMVVANGMSCICYMMCLTWPLYYAINSFFSPPPWTHCYNSWNTLNCTTRLNISLYNSTNHVNHNLTASSAEEFWRFGVLDMSAGIDEMGYLNTNILLCFIGSWFMVFLCLMRGIKSIGKAVYVTATLPYVLLMVLFVRGVTLPGASDGILYFITPTFSRLANFEVWSEAAVQVFYSTCVSWGPLIIMARHNKFHNNCFRDAIILLTLGEGTSIFAGFVVFSILGYMAHSSGLPISEVVGSGPGLAYIAYPKAIAYLPVSNVWAVLFFVMLMMLSIDSEFTTAEPMIELMCDSFQYIRKRRPVFTAMIVIIYCLIGLPLCFQGGIYLFQLFDWYVAAFSVPVFAIIECLVFGWIYGADNFSRDIQLMIGKPVPVFIRILWCFITPIVLLVLFLIIITSYKLPMLGDYSYPPLANLFGMFIAIVPLFPIPVVALLEIRKASGCCLREKLQNSMKPTLKWRPGNKDVVCYDIDRDRHTQFSSFKDRIKLNILGR